MINCSIILKTDIAAFSKLFFDFLKTLKNDLLGIAMQQEYLIRKLFVYISYVVRISIVSTRMSLMYYLYVTCLFSYSYVICMSLVCTRMSSVRHSHVLVCNAMSLVCTRMSLICHSYILVCHSYVTPMYSYVILLSLICIRMPSVCHSYLFLPWTLYSFYLHRIAMIN